MIENTLEGYNALLVQYNQEVENLRSRLEKSKDVNGDPVAMINSRMATSDSNLVGPAYPEFYIQIKHAVVPLLLNFLAFYDALPPEQQTEVNDQKNKTGDYRGLDALISQFSPLPEFVAGLIKAEKLREERLKIPFKPANRNATRQLQEYEEKKRQYDEDRDKIDKDIKEFQGLLQHYNNLRKQ